MAYEYLLLGYILGGITFLPLLFSIIFIYGYFTIPRIKEEIIINNNDKKDNGYDEIKEVIEEKEIDAAGYFAVCREYVPGGINGKPPERTSPGGELLTDNNNPNIYQNVYRSLFERNNNNNNKIIIEGDNNIKRPKNVFFIVLRHLHLLLFDTAEQLEVRHVISLLHHDIDIYGGDNNDDDDNNNILEEGDLWIKKNCIRLIRKPQSNIPSSQPFYIFSDNCSQKEDFYHSLLLAQSFNNNNNNNSNNDNNKDNNNNNNIIKFNTDDIILLVKQLHTSDSDNHSKWLNALIGRIFLSIYKTDDIKKLIITKIEKKISRVSKPTFIKSLNVENVNLGNSAPIISNPKLKELMVDGSLTIEMDIKYNGNFQIKLSSIARIELGSRFRPREVDLLLSGIIKKLNGHLLIKIKPPPSNRLWISFETMPTFDISVEPIVSSLQITYGFILRAIESRIREVFGETLVYPNWDDIPFFDTLYHSIRGGIYHDNSDNISGHISLTKKTITPTKKISTPLLNNNHHDEIISSDVPISPTTSSSSTTINDKPKSMRSSSFASVASPIINTNPAIQRSSSQKGNNNDTNKNNNGQRKEAVELVKEVISNNKKPSTPNKHEDVNNHSSTDDALNKKVTSRKWNTNIAALERATASARLWGMSMINRDSTISSSSLTEQQRNSISGFTSLAKEAGIDQSLINERPKSGDVSKNITNLRRKPLPDNNSPSKEKDIIVNDVDKSILTNENKGVDVEIRRRGTRQKPAVVVLEDDDDNKVVGGSNVLASQ